MGTSSWAFEGWRGLVYARNAPKTKLSRHGLSAYAQQHRCCALVGLDRTYYAPIAAADYHHYAEMAPDDFHFLVKAHELCTMPVFHNSGRYAQRQGEANAAFLDSTPLTPQITSSAPARRDCRTKPDRCCFSFRPSP